MVTIDSKLKYYRYTSNPRSKNCLGLGRLGLTFPFPPSPFLLSTSRVETEAPTYLVEEENVPSHLPHSTTTVESSTTASSLFVI
jgi:hypothetical protein